VLEPKIPKYQWGQSVQALVNLHNDGTYPGSIPDALLVSAGDKGEIVQVGTHTEANMVIYLVEFSEKLVVGCLEDEIQPV
jgi:nitrogen fixation protein NifZ